MTAAGLASAGVGGLLSLATGLGATGVSGLIATGIQTANDYTDDAIQEEAKNRGDADKGLDDRLKVLEAASNTMATTTSLTSVSDRVKTLEDYNKDSLEFTINRIASALDDAWTEDQVKKNNVYDRFLSDQGKTNTDVDTRIKALEDAPDPVTDLSDYYTKT